MPDPIEIWRNAHELVRWRGTDALQYVDQQAAEARDENAWAFWLGGRASGQGAAHRGRTTRHNAALTDC